MANEQNLIPITSRSPAERQAISRKGGLVRSHKKKWSHQLLALKKKGLTDDNFQKIVAIMEEPEASALDIFTFIQSIKADCKNANQKVLVAESLIRWHKAHHGEKIKTENVNININIDKLQRSMKNVEQLIVDIKSEETAAGNN